MGTPTPYQPMPYVRLTHPEWSKNATLYQTNTRQFTPEGTFRAAEAQLARLKVFIVINFSAKAQCVTFREGLYHRAYTDYFGGEQASLDAASELALEAWSYRVFVK